MLDWVTDLERAEKLQARVENDPTAITTVGSELASLAHASSWLVQHQAAEGLLTGARKHPGAMVDLLDDLVAVVLDPAVSTPADLRATLQAVVTASPRQSRDILVESLVITAPEDRDDGATQVLCKGLLCVAVESPVLVVDALDRLRAEFEAGSEKAREAVLQIHFAVVDGHPEAVRPIVPLLPEAFETAESTSRRIAADILCALARDADRGVEIAGQLHDWVSEQPVDPDHIPLHRDTRASVMEPSLTSGVSPGCVGIAMILARIGEESPAALAPHVDDIATTIVTRAGQDGVQWLRGHLTRALAAVARQRPDACRSIADSLHAFLTDEALVVHHWAVAGVKGLANEYPDQLETGPLVEIISNGTENIRSMPTHLIVRGIDTGSVDATAVVDALVASFEGTDGLRESEVFDLLAEIATVAPAAVTPVLPTVADYLTEDTWQAAAVFPPLAEGDPATLKDYVGTLVDTLLIDSLLTRDDVIDTLTTIAKQAPSLLDDELPVLLSSIEDEAVAADSIATVLSPVVTRSVTERHTVCEYVLDRATAESSSARYTAVQLLAEFVTLDRPEHDQIVTVLMERLRDDDEEIHDAAIDALGAFVQANPQAGSTLVKRLHERNTAEWRQDAASILETWVQFGQACPPTDLQYWLANQLIATDQEPPPALTSAAGYILTDETSEERLEAAIETRLETPPVGEHLFTTVREVREQRPDVFSDETVAEAVERTLTTDGSVPTACLDLISTATGSFSDPQQMAEILTHRYVDQAADWSLNIDPLVALCVQYDSEVSVSIDTLCSIIDQRIRADHVREQDRTCRNIARIVKMQAGGDRLRETLLNHVETGEDTNRLAALNAVASVASLWPAGIRPLTETLQEYMTADDDSIRSATLTTLVYISRESPEVLAPLAATLQTKLSASEPITTTRRRYEGIATLVSNGDQDGIGMFEPLLRGLRHDDAAVIEYSMEAVMALDDPRALYPLKRIRDGVPDWSSLPPSSRPEPSETAEEFRELIHTAPEPDLTAADALAVLNESGID